MSSPIHILVTGFPHCGTSILRAIIGHIKDINDITDEMMSIS